MDPTPEQRAADELTANIRLLKEISDLSVTRLEPRIVYQKIIANTSTLLAVEKVSLVLETGQAGLFRIVAASGLEQSIIDQTVIRAGEGIAGHVARTGQPLLVEDIENHPLFRRPSGQSYSTKSLLSVPLLSDGRTIGVINVNNKRSGAPFTELDQFFLSIVGNYIVGVIEKLHHAADRARHRVLERELSAAAEIQKHLFPHQLPRLDDLAFHALNIPAKQLGGDLYDVIQLSRDTFAVAIGDVSGKGIGAALYMSNIAGKIRLLTRKLRNPNRVLGQINTALLEESVQGNFATLLLGFYHRRSRRLIFAVAGHPPPLLRHQAGRVAAQVEVQGGPPLGVVKAATYPVNELNLLPGDCFLLYTDGVVEALDPQRERYGFGRLLARLNDAGVADEAVIHSITRDIERFAAGQERTDDITLLSLVVR